MFNKAWNKDECDSFLLFARINCLCYSLFSDLIPKFFTLALMNVTILLRKATLPNMYVVGNPMRTAEVHPLLWHSPVSSHVSAIFSQARSYASRETELATAWS